MIARYGRVVGEPGTDNRWWVPRQDMLAACALCVVWGILVGIVLRMAYIQFFS